MVFQPVAGSEGQVTSGRLNALAVTSAKRLPTFPNVPTFVEAGVPSMNVSGWLGLVAPAETPNNIAQKLSSALEKVLAQPDFKAKLASHSVEPLSMTVKEFGEFIVSEVKRWTAVITKANIKIN
jgi:tripartite-type tricarboxylate transporter receptor subunit TctC